VCEFGETREMPGGWLWQLHIAAVRQQQQDHGFHWLQSASRTKLEEPLFQGCVPCDNRKPVLREAAGLLSPRLAAVMRDGPVLVQTHVARPGPKNQHLRVLRQTNHAALRERI
jgi:hypothetical protein